MELTIDSSLRWINQLVSDPLARKLIVALLGTMIIFGFSRIVVKAATRTIADSSNKYYAVKAIKALGIVITGIFLANVFSDKLAGLTVAIGVAGAGIAFALQEVIVSVAGWVAIALGGFFRTGDRVQLGGIVGDVIDIGIIRTTLMECGQWVKGDIYSGRIVRVANSFVFKEPVFNYSGDFPFLWDEFTVPVKFGCDHNLARKILNDTVTEVTGSYATEAKDTWKQIVNKYKLENVSLDPVVTLAFNDNWIEFTVRYIVDYQRRRLTKDKLYSLILDRFTEHPKKLAFASATFELVDAPTFNVNLTGVPAK